MKLHKPQEDKFKVLFSGTVYVLQKHNKPSRTSKIWNKKLLVIRNGQQKLFLYDKRATGGVGSQIGQEFEVIDLNPTTVIRGTAVKSATNDHQRFNSSGIALASNMEEVVLVTQTEEENRLLYDTIESVLATLRSYAPEKFELLFFSRKLRPVRPVFVHLLSCKVHIYLKEPTNLDAVNNPDFVIFLQKDMLIFHFEILEKARKNSSERIVFCDNAKAIGIAAKDYESYADSSLGCRFGVVLVRKIDLTTTNVFLFKEEEKLETWKFSLRHSILCCKHNFTESKARVYCYLQDKRLEEHAIQIIKSGFSSLSSLERLDLVDIHLLANSLKMNSEARIELVGAIADLQSRNQDQYTLKREKMLHASTQLSQYLSMKSFNTVSCEGEEFFTGIPSFQKEFRVTSGLNKYVDKHAADLKEFMISQNSSGDIRRVVKQRKTKASRTVQGDSITEKSLMRRQTKNERRTQKNHVTTEKVFSPSRRRTGKTAMTTSQPTLPTFQEQLVNPLVNMDSNRDILRASDASIVYLPRRRNVPETYHTKLYLWGRLPTDTSAGLRATSRGVGSKQVAGLNEDKEPDALYAGPGFVAMISKDRQLYTWGNGPLGHGKSQSESSEPRIVPVESLTSGFNKVTVVTVSCGVTHIACISQGHLFTWGDGPRGQLGLGEIESVNVPTLVGVIGPIFTKNKDDEVISVACGKDHTVALLNNNGEVYTMGGHEHGKLGLGFEEEDRKMPTRVETLDVHTIAQIAAGDTFTLAVTLSGRLCFRMGTLAGSSEYYQPSVIRDFPENNQEIFQVKAAGENCIFLVGDDDDEASKSVYTFGTDANILGTSKKDIYDPVRLFQLEGQDVHHVACSRTQMAALCTEGQAYVWGYNHLNLGGSRTQESVIAPQQLPTLPGMIMKWIACGDQFAGSIYSQASEAKLRPSSAVARYRPEMRNDYRTQTMTDFTDIDV